MNRGRLGQLATASVLALALFAPQIGPALAQDASPVGATPVASPVANLDPAMVAGSSIPLGNDQRTGEARGQGIAGTPRIAWSQPMDTESGWLTAAGDGIVVVQTRTELRVLDRVTGDLLWAVPFDPSNGDPLLDGGVIYTTGVAGAAAYDAATGEQLWAFEPNLDKEDNPDWPLTELSGAPLKLGDTVYVSSSTWGAVYALDAATGQERWRFDSHGDVPGSLAAQDGAIYFSSDAVRPFPEAEGGESALRAIDAETGQELWNIPLGPDVLPFSTTTVADGKAMLTVFDAEAGRIQVRAYDIATQSLAWTTGMTSVIFDGGLAVADGLVFVPGGDSTGIYAFDLATGDLVWERMTADAAPPSPAVADGVLYAQTTVPELLAIDTATGGLLWSLPLGEPSNIGTWGVRLSDGTAFVDTGDTIVAVTGDGGAKPAPMSGSDYPPAAQVAEDAGAYFGATGQLHTSEPLGGPQGIGVSPSGDIYVIEGMNNRIQIFGADGSPKQPWGEAGNGNGQFQFHFDEQGRYGGDIVFGADGTIYVSDMANSRIQVFDKDLNFIEAWPLESEHMVDRPLPTGLALDEAHGRLFIGDWDSDRVLVYDLTGAKIEEWGAGGPGDPVRFVDAFDIAIAPNGAVYITDSNRMRIRSFTPDGAPVSVFGGFGTAPGRFDGVTSVAFDGDGNLYATDYMNNRIQVFSPAGEVIGIWEGASSGLDGFARPWSVAIGPDGKVYVADENFEEGKIAVLTIASVAASIASPTASPAA